jgi:hypothetical protein
MTEPNTGAAIDWLPSIDDARPLAIDKPILVDFSAAPG